MVSPGKKTKGRQKIIEYRYIEDHAKRQVSQCKRKRGILKKGLELHLLSGANVAIVIFSNPKKRGKPNVFAMGTPSVDHVLHRFAPLLPVHSHLDDAGSVATVAAQRAAAEETVREMEETEVLVDAEKARMKAVGEKVLQAAEGLGRRFWWEADVDALGEAELPEFAAALQRLRKIVQHQANKLQTFAPPVAPPAMEFIETIGQ